MYSVFMLTIASFVVALILTPLFRNLAIRWDLVDQPDHIRKFHTRGIPRIGGISIFIAYFVSFSIIRLSPFPLGDMVRGHLDVVRSIFPSAAIIFFTGLLDDLLGLKAWQKFAGQLAALGVTRLRSHCRVD
jgi:UDP-GlcNAc:undecaprenyl-phosphate GlcNAc-1-phosphate transferase